MKQVLSTQNYFELAASMIPKKDVRETLTHAIENIQQYIPCCGIWALCCTCSKGIFSELLGHEDVSETLKRQSKNIIQNSDSCKPFTLDELPDDKCNHFLSYKLSNGWVLLLGFSPSRIESVNANALKQIAGQLSGIIKQIIQNERYIWLKEINKDISDHIPKMVWETDKNGKITFANPLLIQTLNLTESQIEAGIYIQDLFSEKTQTTFNQLIHETSCSQGASQFELNITSNAGNSLPVLAYTFTIYYGKNLTGLRGIMFDITERKQKELKLKKQQKIYQQALAQQSLISELALTFNNLDRFETVVKNALKAIGEHTDVSRVYIFEDDEKAACTSNTYEWCNDGIEPQIDNLQKIPYKEVPSLKQLLDNDGMIYSENIHDLPDDIYQILEPQKIQSIVVYPVFYRKKRMGFIGFDECNENKKWSFSELELLRSLSGIFSTAFSNKKVMEHLEQAKNEAEKANEEKARFLSTMSHEIRTPLSAVINLSKLIDEENLTEEQIDYHKKIKVSADNLLNIINDVLDFSKIEAGKIELERTTFDLNEVFNEITQTMIPKTADKAVEIKHHVDEKIEHYLYGDQVRIKQVIINLVNNAIKFTEKGYISITADLVKERKDYYAIRFKVEDTGIGISKDYLDSLFESFTQEDNSTTRMYGGTGLGLTISKELVHLMDGQLFVDSTKGKGSTFSFELELEYVTDYNAESESNNAQDNDDFLKDKHIMVVEDNLLIQQTTKAFLQKWGINVSIANNGLECMSKLNDQDYDMLLMDNQMPVMNGIEATQKIRQENKSDIPIIAMTADAVKEIIQECMDAGMNGYITKPYEPKNLKSVLINNMDSVA
ncbi:MAG: response regulator [Bacteroidales bacterium]|nr:response regulator [Bacteroidales bacterium]